MSNPYMWIRSAVRASAPAAVFLAVTLTTAFAAGHSTAPKSVEVPFTFTVAGETFGAGRYRVTAETSGDNPVVVLQNGGREIKLPVIARLAAKDKTAGDAKMIFDKAKGEHFLSEVWLPGQDGFLVFSAKGEEGHDIAEESKK
jgi:hypothetical protein